MHSQKTPQKPKVVAASVALLLVSAGACNPRSSSEKREEKSSAPTAVQNASGSGIDLNCVMDHLQNPPEAFHYTFKHDTSDDNLVQDADLTPDSIQGTSKSKYGNREIKGTKSDETSWRMASMSLSAISSMSSTIALVRNSSAIVREGTEKINGYDTTRYSIDTARGDAAEAGLYRATLGEGGFEKGMAWVTAQGCPVKLSLDSEMHLKNGSVEKTHYEIEVVKK